jgi:hypothetical protein
LNAVDSLEFPISLGDQDACFTRRFDECEPRLAGRRVAYEGIDHNFRGALTLRSVYRPTCRHQAVDRSFNRVHSAFFAALSDDAHSRIKPCAFHHGEINAIPSRVFPQRIASHYVDFDQDGCFVAAQTGKGGSGSSCCAASKKLKPKGR